MSILPNIVDIAMERLDMDKKTMDQKEVRFVCPWCAHQYPTVKYHLSINTHDNVYKCWSCGQSGGAVDFIAQMEGKSREEVLDELKRRHGIKKRRIRHPAETLSTYQLRMIGHDDLRKYWSSWWKQEPSLTRWYLDEVWKDWEDFLDYQRYRAFQLLLTGIRTGKYRRAIEQIQEQEKEIGHELLQDVIHAYGRGHHQPEWAEGAQELVDELLKQYKPATAG